MEHVPASGSASEDFEEMNAGTANDHLVIGIAHLKRAASLAVFGPGARPASGADVSVAPAAAAPEEEQKDANGAIKRPWGIILPTDSWKETWDVVVLQFILYSAVMVPYRICFDASASGYMFIFEQVVTLSFMADVYMNFNQAYMDDEKWIMDRGKIAYRYFQGWFWIDAPSSVPVELIDMFIAGDSSQLGMLRFLRLFRLLRLLRLLKLGEYIAALEIKFDLNLTILRIFQMVAAMVFLAHMLGCFWFYVAACVGINDETVTWVSSYDDGSAMYADPSVQYLYSVYWALTTLTTVGYGDITPSNDPERLYSLFSLLTGALVFGFMLSSIGSLVAAIDRQAALSEERMDEIKEYMRWRQLPRDLVLRMRRYYTYYYQRKTAFDEKSILGALTPALRFEVVQHTLKETIGKIPLFASTLDPLFQMEIFPLLTPVSAAPREVIFNKGENSQALFFLIKGQVEVISGVDGRVLHRIKAGNFFGESVITGRRRAATHRAASSCDMMCISGDDLSELFTKRPREGRVIHHAVLTEHLKKERMRNLSLRLLANRMEKGDGEQPLGAAALRLQMAWNKAQDHAVFQAAEFDENGPDEQPASSALLPQQNEDSPVKRANTRAAASFKGKGAGGSTDPTVALAEKLDRMERLLVPLLGKLEQVPSKPGFSDRSKKRS